MSLLERELEEFDREGIWPVVYHRLKNEASINHNFTVKSARLPQNRNRNRYRDVSPYDHSRVILNNSTNDYINASLVEVPTINRRYILTQGPLRLTSGHFWQMIWDQDSRAVIMLNRVIERETVKCDQYWPNGAIYGCENEMLYEDAGIKVTFLDESEASYYTIRRLLLENLNTEEQRIIHHFHYTTWPDFGVPQSPAAFLNFLMAVRRSGLLENDVGPAVIHCSAGIGRSGTFCLVDSCLLMIEQSREMSNMDIRGVLMDMRKYRMGLIQTPDQLRFSYIAVLEGGNRILSSPDSGFIEFDQEPPPKPPRRLDGIAPESSSDDEEDEEVILSSEDEPPLTPNHINLQENDLSSTENDDGIEAGQSGVTLEPVTADVETVEAATSSKVNDLQPSTDEPHTSNDTDKLIDNTDDSEQNEEVRRRKKEERQKNSGEQLEAMRKAMEKHHVQRNPKPHWWQVSYFSVGLSITLLVGGLLLYRYWL